MLSDLDDVLDNNHKAIKDVLCSLSEYKILQENNIDSKLNNNIKKLAEVYENSDFRHEYSKVFLILTRIDKENNLSLDELTESMEKMKEKLLADKNLENIKHSFSKIYDHVILEILQIKYMREVEAKGEQNNINMIKVSEEVKSLNDKNKQNANENQQQISLMRDKLNSIQREYITILGIFASIILAFVAGLTFTNSVLANIEKASIYRLTFIVCLIGLFITNIVHFLYTFIENIHFEKSKVSVKDSKSYIYKFNILISIIILAIYVYWLCSR